MLKRLSFVFCILFGLGLSILCHGQNPNTLTIATLHPIFSDMVKQIGGEHVTIINLLQPNGNLHTFEPSPQDVAGLSKADFLLASGKNMEPYLGKLKDSLSTKTRVLELGDVIPDVPVVDTLNSDHHDHGPSCSCSHGPNDPHWWHTPANMKRAARLLTKQLSEARPEWKDDFNKALAQWNKNMDSLDTWAKKELAPIPQNKRVIVTGHAAMNHFCKQYHFKALAVQGISRDDEGNTARLSELLKQLRQEKIQVIFPEYSSNPKVLEELAKSLQMKVGKPLNTDGLMPNSHSFESVFKMNVKHVKEALTEPDAN